MNVIYLDHNVFSDLASTDLKNQTSINLIATLMYLQKTLNSRVVYSDIHLQELSRTGHKSKRLKEEINFLINRDLRFIKFLTKNKRIYKNLQDANFYIHEVCPIEQYQNLCIFKSISDQFLKILNILNQPEQVELSRQILKLGPKVLNNAKTFEDAQLQIADATKNIPTLLKSLSEDDLQKQKQLTHEAQQKINQTILEINESIKDLTKNAMTNANELDEELKETINKALSEFDTRMNTAIIDAQKTENSHDNTNFNLDELIDKIKAETKIDIDKHLIEQTLRNFMGFESKNLKFGPESDYFDIQHSVFIPSAMYFVTNEAKNFRKRFGTEFSNIFSKEEFLEELRTVHKINITVNIND